jgi:uncharacterized membrane protein
MRKPPRLGKSESVLPARPALPQYPPAASAACMTELTFLFVVALIFLVVRLYLRLKEAESGLSNLSVRINALEAKQREERLAGAPAENAPAREATPPPKATPAPTVIEQRETVPPPLPAFARSPVTLSESPLPAKTTAPVPPPVAPPAKEEPILPAFTLEAFMGVKLFAWLGGLALFLGVIFLIRYSFEHNLITPAMRVALGALTGLGLIVAGLLMPRPKFAVTAQTLCATGIVVLYGVTFSAHSLYHFLGLFAAFGFMAAITAGAFLIAVRLEAQVVAILGLLAGFLTPILLSTGVDNPAGLFGYLAVLDAGLMAVALRQRWRHHVTLAAVATALMQIAWCTKYFEPAKIGIATLVFLGFEALFLLPFWRCNDDETGDSWTTSAAGILAGTALGYAACVLGWPELGQKPWIVLTIALAADAGLVAWPLRRTALQPAPLIGGGIVFLLLGVWNVRYLNDALLYWALGFYLVFAAFHTALPIVLRRLRPAATTPRWAQVFPALGLVLMLWPALKIGASTALWAAVLIADLAAIALAALTASLLGVVAALVLTLLAVALWLAQTPTENPSILGLLAVIAGFAALFCGASVFLQHRLAASGLASSAAGREQEALQHLPAISAVLPFLLLISVVERLQPFNPSLVFGVGLLLVVMLLALARWSDTLALPPIALGCGVLLEYCWHLNMRGWVLSPEPGVPFLGPGGSPVGGLALSWYLGFAAMIAAFPFLFQNRTSPRLTPWATAALAPVLHYPLFYDAASRTWPAFGDTAPGLIPATFALPALAACDYLRRVFPRDNPARLGVLAWFGGVALFFITLIFPAQFDHEWLTISWALEGTALCWLFHRLPHPGLRLVGFVLLGAAFVRLTLNPAVLSYHARSGVPLWNWYLYTYGLAAAASFAGGYLLRPPRERLGEINLCATLSSLGTILLFLLLNIEIADFFATTPTLTFDFSGNLARDMTYSIAWALFALGLLLVGMHRQLPPVRYAGLALFVITLVKLFLHDLANLDQLYRIGAFIAVAILLIGASYLYQRFLAVDEKDGSPPDLSS